MGMMVGDAATANVLQGLNQQLQGARDPNTAMHLQQQMAGQQMQGAQNLFAAANAPRQRSASGPAVDTTQSDLMARQGAMENLQRAQQGYGQNMQALQQARNLPNPLLHLGVPGMAAGAGGDFRQAYNQSTSPLLSALGG